MGDGCCATPTAYAYRVPEEEGLSGDLARRVARTNGKACDDVFVRGSLHLLGLHVDLADANIRVISLDIVAASAFFNE